MNKNTERINFAIQTERNAQERVRHIAQAAGCVCSWMVSVLMLVLLI